MHIRVTSGRRFNSIVLSAKIHQNPLCGCTFLCLVRMIETIHKTTRRQTTQIFASLFCTAYITMNKVSRYAENGSVSTMEAFFLPQWYSAHLEYSQMDLHFDHTHWNQGHKFKLLFYTLLKLTHEINCVMHCQC